jgi:hypothetical protein
MRGEAEIVFVQCEALPPGGAQAKALPGHRTGSATADAGVGRDLIPKAACSDDDDLRRSPFAVRPI